MEFNDNDRRPLYIDGLTTTIPLDTATVTIAVDNTEHPCTLTDVTNTDGTWTATATTATIFRGPANPGEAGDTLLTYGAHNAELRITNNNGHTYTRALPAILVE